MRSHIILAFGTIVLVLAIAPASVAQRGMPYGSYQQTCRDVRANGYTLYARCQRVDGGWNNTTLNYQNCPGEVINDNGNLRCGGGRGYAPGYAAPGYANGRWQGSLPPGDFKRTCRNPYMTGDKLSATCQRVDGGWNNTSLKNVGSCQTRIVNDNGNLRCAR